MFRFDQWNKTRSGDITRSRGSIADFGDLTFGYEQNDSGSGLILPEGSRTKSDPELPGNSKLSGINRRKFLAKSLAASSSSLLLPSLVSASSSSRCADVACTIDLSDKQYRVLIAFIEAQLCALWRSSPSECAHAVARDIMEYMSYTRPRFQKGLGYLLTWLNVYSLKIYKRRFCKLGPQEVWALLNQGEYQGCSSGRKWSRKRPPLITFDCNYVEHLAVSTLAMLVRMVTCSRKPARLFVGMTWSPECRDPANLTSVRQPPRPCLNQHYDVCVIGSGAGGVTVAARAAKQGKRVLIIESGRWFSPDELIQSHVNCEGKTELLPARGDQVLMHLYKEGGVQLAKEQFEENFNALDVILPGRRKKIKPRQTINVLQAQVAGGGPNVNNAIHLEIKQHVWDNWGERQPYGVDYQLFNERMQQIKQDLGVNMATAGKCASERSMLFRRGCELSGNPVEPTPVSIRNDCKGCGSDNSMDPFGSHIGGVHNYQPGRPNSYLMEALNAVVPAEIACELSAVRFDISRDCGPHGGHRVNHLVVEDRRGLKIGQSGPQFTVNADQFVLSAGPVSSTKLLAESYRCAGLKNCELGTRFNGNVGTPVYAVFKKPLIDGTPARPEPGIAQCFIASEELDWSSGNYRLTKPALENWFHYPGTIAIALTGWFHDYARILRCYNHLSIAGMFVPTRVRCQNRISPEGKIAFSLDAAEHELLIRGMERIAEIYLAAATPDNPVELFLPTKGMLLDDCGRPFRIRNRQDLTWALEQVRCRGPEFVNLLSSHPQGGNPLGSVVDPGSFRAMDDCGRTVDNLYVADASIFPAGCEINPQLTVKALASFAADHMLAAA